MEVVLYQPEIPPNTGNVARLCAAMEIPLHLVRPLGFSLEDRYLRRAGLDYWPHVMLTVWDRWDDFLEARSTSRKVYTSARRGIDLFEYGFRTEDCLLFGPETRGFSWDFAPEEHVVRIPMRGEVRSLNLSTAVGIVLYEALRQTGYFKARP